MGCCGKSRVEEEEEDLLDLDDAELKKAAAKREAEAKAIANIAVDAAVSVKDAGSVEIAVATLRDDAARLRKDKNMETSREPPATVTLYYNRAALVSKALTGDAAAAAARAKAAAKAEGGGGGGGADDDAKASWVVVGKRECQPDKNELGGMVVNFREKALRRVHTYTGPGALSVALVQ